MGTKSCTKILNFSTRFSFENLAVEDFVTLAMGKNLVDGEMFSLGMASTNKSMFARLGTDYEIRNQRFFTILEAMNTN